MKAFITEKEGREGVVWGFAIALSVLAMITVPAILGVPISSATTGPNLVKNPSLEQAVSGSGALPLNWSQDSWGTNTPVFTYLTTGHDGSRAGQTEITAYTNGDAKWSFDHVAVVPGTVYRYSDYYRSTVPTELFIEYANTNNVLSYVSLGTLPLATDWSLASKTFTVPAGMRSATVYHVISSIGRLAIDSVSLSSETSGSGSTGTGSTASGTGNLISNPSVEISSGANAKLPLDWGTDSWGTNTPVFIYQTGGQDGTKGLRVQMTAYTTGDAKWYFRHVSVIPGKTYLLSDYYRSDVRTTATLEYKLSSGKYSYVELGTLPSALNWTRYSSTFTPPSGALSVSMLHYLSSVGYLETDNFTLSSGTGGGDPPSTGTGSGSGTTSGTGTSDTTPPTISIQTPVSASTLTGTIQLTARATDNIGVAGVTFSIDGVFVGSGNTGTGSADLYGMLFDSTTLTNGTHSIGARVTDRANNTQNATPVSVTINNPIPDTEVPKISIVSPSRGAILSGTSTLSISATDNVAIVSVHYSITNGTDMTVGELTAAPYTITIPASVLKNGSHTISAYASDAAGNIGNASPVVYNTYFLPPEPLSPNLITNPSMETASGNAPDVWMKGSWGTNTAVFTYPVAGTDGDRASQVSIGSYTDGDAKWYFSDVSVTPGAVYAFSDRYKSTTSSTLTARYTNTDGTFSYSDVLPRLPASSDWITASQTITVPANATKLTVFHLINSVGTLDIDAAELRISSSGSTTGPIDANAFPTGLVSLTFDDGWGSQYDNALPILDGAGIKGSFYIITNEMKNAVNANRIANPSFEIADAASVPSGWTGVTATGNTASFSYPVPGISGAKAAKVEIVSYQGGDARWQPDSTTVVNGEIYNFTDQYKANVPTKVTVVYSLTNNSTQAFDLGTVPASDNWSIASFTFTPPVNTKTLTVYHRLVSTGVLTTDDYHLDIAQDYMNLSQVKAIYNNGHEVSAHTRTHPFLTQLSGTQAIAEISGARQDMISAGFTPSDVFVYPYGDYNSGVIQMTKDAGYIGARSVDQGYNTRVTNKYTLQIQEINSATTPEQWESWTRTAMQNHTWLILMFHQIDHQIDQYGATAEDLQSYVNYLTTNGIPTVTVARGLGMMNP